jgi:ComF family protein
MTQAIVSITKSFINLFYPLHCAACKKSLDPGNEFGVCDFCRGQIRQNPRPYCGLCGRSLKDNKKLCAECRRSKFYFTKAHSAYLYEGVLKELIHKFKYNRKLYLARMLSSLMADFIKENLKILDGIDTITYVPLSSRRLRTRGFDQAKVLASHLAMKFGVPLSDTLKKLKSTRNQNELSRDDRLVNLKGAFRMINNTDFLKGQRVLLIDDVMTTGTTLDECSKILLDGGAGKVSCLTLARGL